MPHPAGPASAALAGIDPDTGRVAWTDRDLLAPARQNGAAPTAVAPAVTLPDGRTVLLSGTADGTGLALRQLDPRTGATRAPSPCRPVSPPRWTLSRSPSRTAPCCSPACAAATGPTGGRSSAGCAEM